MGETGPQRVGVQEVEREEVIIEVVVPCVDLAFAETVEEVAGARFSAGGIAGVNREAVIPLLWGQGTDIDRLEVALRSDPSTATVTRLTNRGVEHLFRIEWTPAVTSAFGVLTGGCATILDCSVDRDGWRIRMLFPSQTRLQEAMSQCEHREIGVDIRSIRQMNGESVGQYGLTDAQRRALEESYEQGYFRIPRQAELNEIAESLDITHQALSELVRRGTEELIAQALLREKRDGQELT